MTSTFHVFASVRSNGCAVQNVRVAARAERAQRQMIRRAFKSDQSLGARQVKVARGNESRIRKLSLFSTHSITKHTHATTHTREAQLCRRALEYPGVTRSRPHFITSQMPYMPANRRPCDGGTGSLGGRYGPFSPMYTYLRNSLREIIAELLKGEKEPTKDLLLL